MVEDTIGTEYEEPESPSHSESRHSPEPRLARSATEKLACLNCRKRKVKCDRSYPCSYCARTNVLCSFPLESKPRPKRQRVHISSIYESKIDRIAQKVDEVNQTLRQLTIGCPLNALKSSPSQNQLQVPPSTSTSSSLQPTPSSSTGTPIDPSVIGEDGHNDPSKAEYEGEPSLFAHAVYATKYLQSSINSNSSPRAALEMNSVLNALRKAVDAQKQRTDTPATLYPNARPLALGENLRDLPMPDTNKVLASLRMAQESRRIEFLWLMEFQSISTFTSYFIKVCAPGSGSATAADLIIVNAGLYWLFCECAHVVTDEQMKRDYNEQALIAMANLETVLSRLPFHIPATVDYIYAMGMASMYCLQKAKPSAAWSFISSASQLCQTLGLHSNAPIPGETSETRQGRAQLFWAIYTAERMLALRLGRSSTIRDHDITVPRMGHTISPHALLNELFPIWIATSDLQGRVYDEIYSPGALAQPEAVRTCKARALADESKRLLQAQDEIQSKYTDDAPHTLGPGLARLVWRAERVTGLSILTLIYRSLPPDGTRGSVFSAECIDTARDAVREHEQCVAIFTDEDLQSSYFEVYMSWVFLQTPFTPFIVLFCHMIETSDSSDLCYLQNLVETLLLASKTSHHPICQKQLGLFRALHDVAVKFFEVKNSAAEGSIIGLNMAGSNPNAGGTNAGVAQPTSLKGNMATAGPGMAPVSQLSGGVDAQMSQPLGHTNFYGSPMADLLAWQPHNAMLGELGMEEGNLSKAELAPWFYANQHMMRILDDM